CQQYNSFPFTV
nr:immunoglobulin light chain junction region [Macaca mulatta]